MRHRTHPSRRLSGPRALPGAARGTGPAPSLDDLAVFEAGTGTPHDLVALAVGLLLAFRAIASQAVRKGRRGG